MNRQDLLRKVMEHGSLRPALKNDSIVVQGEFEGKDAATVRAELQKVARRCTGLQSIKVIPAQKKHAPNAASNRAFLNFDSGSDASKALASLRGTTLFGKVISGLLHLSHVQIVCVVNRSTSGLR
jgi:RNA recognition motif. (a.k.a. RRM, RBD, or RNP domain)